MSSSFKNHVKNKKKKLKWMRLDNAAKIYPAAQTSDWSNVYRMSATLTEDIDTTILKSALEVIIRRFPSIAGRLQQGVFWYYIEEVECCPDIREEYSYPLTRMSHREIQACAFRVIVYNNRIAVEFFHSLTDGNGALIFTKNLIAEYLEQKYKITISKDFGVMDRQEKPRAEELEDSFLKYAAPISASRRERTAWHLTGTLEPSGCRHLTCFKLSAPKLLEKAHEQGVTVTTYLAAILMLALQNLQAVKVPSKRRRKPIKVLLPVNLRNIFPSESLRNFALYVTPEILPQLGSYSFDEICSIITHCLGTEATPKQMGMKIATNVSSERILLLRIMPLFLKNIVMKAVFRAVGETKSCLSLSNLGRIALPSEMQPYVNRMDFILGVQASAPYNCGVLTYKDTVYINFIRNTKEPDLEFHFHKVLEEMGMIAEVESNESYLKKEN